MIQRTPMTRRLEGWHFGLITLALIVFSSVLPAQTGGKKQNATKRPLSKRIAERLKKLDTNGDGAIDKSEWKGRDRIFARLDRNGDGRITRADIGRSRQPGIDRPKRDKPKTDKPAGEKSPTDKRKRRDVFVDRDLDGDGKWNRREFPGNDAAWRIADENRDGFIDAEEWAQVRAVRRGGGDQPDRRRRALRRVMQQDKDGDGRVSRAEFTGPGNVFTRLDANKDGFLDRKDLRASKKGDRKKNDRKKGNRKKGGKRREADL